MNFFGDHHGKNARDAHFSHVSRFVENYSLKQRLTCSQDIVDAIYLGQRLANENSIKILLFFEL